MGLMKGDLESMTPSFGAQQWSGQFLRASDQLLLSVPVQLRAAGATVDRQQRRSTAPMCWKKFSFSPARTPPGREWVTLWTRLRRIISTRFTVVHMSDQRDGARTCRAVLYTNFLTNSVLPVSPTNHQPEPSGGRRGASDRARLRPQRPVDDQLYHHLQFGRHQLLHHQPQRLVLRRRRWARSDFTCSATRCRRRWRLNWACSKTASIQRAESLPDGAAVSWARSNYLAQQAGKVHLFRQRFPIRNVDPSAYQ